MQYLVADVRNHKYFNTKIQDIYGTWNCESEHFNVNTQQTYKETYTITLNSDGTVQCSKYENIVSGEWSYGRDGHLYISIMDIATQTFNSGFRWDFQANDPKNPTIFDGIGYGWNFNNVIGYVQHDGNGCILTR